jgi:hypothetical protein
MSPEAAVPVADLLLPGGSASAGSDEGGGFEGLAGTPEKPLGGRGRGLRTFGSPIIARFCSSGSAGRTDARERRQSAPNITLTG